MLYCYYQKSTLQAGLDITTVNVKSIKLMSLTLSNVTVMLCCTTVRIHSVLTLGWISGKMSACQKSPCQLLQRFFRTFRKANKAVFSWIIVVRAVCLCVADRFRSLWQSQQCLNQFYQQSRSTRTSPRCSNLQPALHPGLHSNLGRLLDRCYLRPVSDDLVFSHIAFH